MRLRPRGRRFADRLARRVGYELTPIAPPAPPPGPRSDERNPLPPGAGEELRADHPRLRELRERYARVDGPLARHTQWAVEIREELDLTRFRGDNVYVWQLRSVGEDSRLKYHLLLRDVASRDRQELLGRLKEDGLFGCWTFEYEGWPVVSRDLLDSVNELGFLDRHMQVLERPGLTVLDVGAGYGRLAHRALEAAPKLGRYLCADAIPESTFLCEYYLRFRGCGDRAEIVPLDRLDEELSGRSIDLAVSIHSFSEMALETVEAWVSRLAALEVPWLFVVPNDADRLLTRESDWTRRDFGPVLDAHGYEPDVVEPVVGDPAFRELIGMTDHFFLLRKR